MFDENHSLYFKSLNREFNVFGVNRQLFYLFVGLCLPIAFSGQFKPLMDFIAISVFMFLYIIGVLVTRIDSQILEIYKRDINYKKYYAAVPGIHSKQTFIKPSVPFYQGKTGII